jgi:hypothetical protein
MAKANRVTADEWIQSFKQVMADSQQADPDTFNAIASSLSGAQKNGFLEIKLDTSGLKGADHEVVERAIRKAFNDNRASHHPDAIFTLNGKKIEVEVKHSPQVISVYRTDSRGLNDKTGKWYIYAMGSVDGTSQNQFKAWLMRSKELFVEVMTRRGFMSPQIQQSLGPMSSATRNYIDTNQPNAEAEIEREIHNIAARLARSVMLRSQDIGRTSKDPSMSLDLPVMANRVRFEIKFESLLRKTISEILKD